MGILGGHGLFVGERNTLNAAEILIFKPGLCLEVRVEETDGAVAVTADEVLLLTSVDGHHLVDLNELVWIHLRDKGHNFDQSFLVLLTDALDDQ